MPYLLFIIRCILGKFKFFTYKPLHQAHLLAQSHLFFEAGCTCMRHRHFVQAIDYFKQTHAPRHLLYCYYKNGQPSEALAIAETHHLPKAGAKIAHATGNHRKAAYFYAQYNLPEAIKHYKQLEDYFCLGHCYLKARRFSSALHAFNTCTDPIKRLEGLAHIEEVAIVSYLTKDYKQAFYLFQHLNDPYSTYACAEKLHKPALLEKASIALATYLFECEKLQEAAYHMAPFNPSLARLYLYLHQCHDSTLTLAFYEGRFAAVLSYCFAHDALFFAKELTHYWLALDDTPRDTNAMLYPSA